LILFLLFLGEDDFTRWDQDSGMHAIAGNSNSTDRALQIKQGAHADHVMNSEPERYKT
jgi:hypothetical protein